MRTIVGLSLIFAVAVGSAARAQNPYGGGYVGGAYGGGYPSAYGGFGGALSPWGGYGSASSGLGMYRGLGGTVSPYLNILGGRNPAANYYNIARPLMYGQPRTGFNGYTGMGAFQRSLFPTLQSIDEDELPGLKVLPKKNENDPSEPVRVQLPPTGHAAGFGNSMGYFGPLMATQGGLGSAGRAAAAQSQRRSR